ncbi:MAG: 3',5'-cyclic-nucleotide phosphodiesterase [Pseudomonadota bacterium]|nr:3',5'-cyclic-nucleotide phosphodiesterase [Pseudomonadota bacterium]
MQVRVLGCSGGIAKDCRTTSFLLDHDLLVDAGTGVGDLTLDEMLVIDHVLLTHSHLDHIAALPLMIDSVAAQRDRPVQVYALQATIDALKTHIFNNVIWPDFSRLPTPAAPFILFHPLELGQTILLAGKTVEVLPAVHSVPAAGYAVAGSLGGNWVFTGDTSHNPALWARLNRMDVAMLVIETAFSNCDAELAERSQHLCPQSLAAELDCIEAGRCYPIYLTHLKPAQKERIMAELEKLTHRTSKTAMHPIEWLQAGQVFKL